MRHYDISDQALEKFKELCKKRSIKYKNEMEYKESAQNLLRFVGTLVEIDMEERKRKNRLKKEPKGFALEGQGRTCSLCRNSANEGDGWYDKWGFKCMNCQDAVNKKKIPGSLCSDWDHKRCVTDSILATKAGLHTQTIRKLIRNKKIKAQQIPKGPFLILRKDNPNLMNVIDAEKAEQARNS